MMKSKQNHIVNINKMVISVASVFKGRAKKYNHFQKTDSLIRKNRCSNCIRRKFSYPYTCNDGWPCGDKSWEDRGYACANWTDDPKAEVD